ncbi:MAG TPA: MnhB domain-containing protein [Tichowtungia sp.]|nr:MnhB domain-containing protein [Tichowtungia sp.]
MSKIVRTAANLLFPFILIFGFYVIVHGHLTPGGGFQGGAVMATGLAMIIAAHNYERIQSAFKKDLLKTLEGTALVLFLTTAVSGFVVGKPFLTNWIVQAGGLFGGEPTVAGNLNTGGIIPLLNVFVGLEVLGALTLIVLTMLSGAKENS